VTRKIVLYSYAMVAATLALAPWAGWIYGVAAAALGVAYKTAWAALTDGDLQRGDTLLVQAGSSGTDAHDGLSLEAIGLHDDLVEALTPACVLAVCEIGV